jgi:hypothetical protein
MLEWQAVVEQTQSFTQQAFTVPQTLVLGTPLREKNRRKLDVVVPGATEMAIVEPSRRDARVMANRSLFKGATESCAPMI